MPYPKSVKIAGTDITEVEGVTISIDTPQNARGHYDGRTNAGTIQLLRRARNSPTAAMFKNATNQDGRYNPIQATIVLQDSKHQETYTIDAKKCYIQSWEFHQPPKDSDMYETITLKVGALKLSGGGGSDEFTVPDFDRA